MGLLQHGLPPFGIGHIMLPGKRSTSAKLGIDSASDLLCTFAVDVRHRDLGALARKHPGCRFAKALRPAGHKRHFS